MHGQQNIKISKPETDIITYLHDRLHRKTKIRTFNSV